MSRFKAAVLDTSLFRRSYIICLFLCNVTLLLIPAYIGLAVTFVWGAFLVIYNEVKKHTALKTRYGLWLILFLFGSVVTLVFHISSQLLTNVYNIAMLFHMAICFFIFYGVHTEKHLNFRREFYSICSFVVYASTVLGIIGLACLMAGIKVEVFHIGFIIFENRFTGMYMNPNYLGYIAVFAIFCCHALTKKDFIAISGRERVSRIWLGSCVVVNGISLLLCDSNASMVLMIGYAVVYCVYKIFCGEFRFDFRLMVKKTAASLLAGVFIVASLLFVRHIVQLGFTEVVRMTSTITVLQEEETAEEEVVTFEHENTNVDSGRITLWKQAAEMFTVNPVMGVGRGNIFEIGEGMFEHGVKFSDKYGWFAPYITDFHNGYIMIIISAGAYGFILFCIFGIRFFLRVTRHVLRNTKLTQSMLPCMFAFLCAYMLFAMVEITILFNLTFMVVSFWLIMGYTSCFLVRFEPDHPIQTFSVFGRKFRRTLL